MIEPKYSTFWPRFCADIVDSLIFSPFAWAIAFLMSHFTSIPIRIVVYLISSAAYPVYSIWMHGKYGQTLGKMACKVMVLDISENPLTMKQAALRDILAIILFPIALITDIPRIAHGIDIFRHENFNTIDRIVDVSTQAWVLIEIVTMLTNKKRRALHDFIAGSVVVRVSPKPPEPYDALPVA